MLKRIDLEGISRLLDSGFSFKECLILLEDEKNKQIFKVMRDKLEEGYAIEEFIQECIELKMKSTLVSLLSFLKLNDAIKLTLKLEDYDKVTRQQFAKSLIAPLAMFLGCLLGISLFTRLCFPSLYGMLESFNLTIAWIGFASTLLNWLTQLLLLVLLLCFFIFLYFNRPQKIVLGYILLSKFHCSKTFRLFLSTQFAVYFNECAKLGNSTQQILFILQQLKNKPLIVFLAYHVEQALLKGETMEEAMTVIYLDPSLHRFMQIACHSSSLNEMLKSYIEQNEEKGKKLCKKWAKQITLFSYISIGVLVILIYEILLLPLSIIGQM